jgi:hypothetical protein
MPAAGDAGPRERGRREQCEGGDDRGGMEPGHDLAHAAPGQGSEEGNADGSTGLAAGVEHAGCGTGERSC